MARFYADIQGNRGMATRMGTPNSGIKGHIRGWHQGARVECYVNDQGEDVTDICVTSGSSGHKSSKHIARIVNGVCYIKDDDGHYREIEW